MPRPFLSTACLVALLAALPGLAVAQDAAVAVLAGAERVGDAGGPITAWRRDGRLLLSVLPEAVGQPFLWYVEVVGLPAGVAANGNEVGTRLVRLERQGEALFVRDLTVASGSRPATPGDGPTATGADGASPPPDAEGPGDNPAEGLPVGDGGAGPFGLSDPTIEPIAAALSLTQTGPVLAALPIAGEDGGALVVDATDLFAGDVGGLSAGSYVALSGLLPQGVDPSRSGIEAVRMVEDTLVVRSGVTFLAVDPANPAAGLAPVSLRLGHSLTWLPEEPMEPRYADPRVGFFTTSFLQLEDAAAAAAEREVIARFRLEKRDPLAAVSDPVEPITFWIGPGVPARWRGAMRDAVLLWNPVFEAAGLSNALRVEEAPPGDPDWFVEDAGRNVIRWLPVRRVNAMGPHVVDPRSGETLFSHVLVWPAVIDYFSLYYHALFSSVDPRAARLPLPLDLQQELMTYIVAHEVGHALGLRHNHLASTVWTVAQMRDPAFEGGPNASIMAYGRFNQVAQPGDGVTRLHAAIGPYDLAAIRWGYGDFPNDAALDAFAAGMAASRETQWGAGEFPAEASQEIFDPRVQMENTGAERLEATRLGVANTLRTLQGLPEATGGDATLLRSAYAVTLGVQVQLLRSTGRLVGGTMPLHDGAGVVTRVPPQEQAAAVAYLLGEGARSLEPFRDPAILEQVAVYGGGRSVDRAQAALIDAVIDGPRLGLLDSQADLYPGAYGPADLGRDAMAAVWGDLDASGRSDRVLREAWIDAHEGLVATWGQAAAVEAAGLAAATAEGLSPDAAGILVETGDDTAYPAWLRDALPDLRDRVAAAATEAGSDADRRRFEDLAARLAGLMAALD